MATFHCEVTFLPQKYSQNWHFQKSVNECLFYELKLWSYFWLCFCVEIGNFYSDKRPDSIPVPQSVNSLYTPRWSLTPPEIIHLVFSWYMAHILPKCCENCKDWRKKSVLSLRNNDFHFESSVALQIEIDFVALITDYAPLWCKFTLSQPI